VSRRAAQIGLAAFFAAAGGLHFAADEAFVRIMPPAIPFPTAVVWATGVMEFVFAAALAARFQLRWTGLALSL